MLYANAESRTSFDSDTSWEYCKNNVLREYKLHNIFQQEVQSGRFVEVTH